MYTRSLSFWVVIFDYDDYQLWERCLKVVPPEKDLGPLGLFLW